MAKKIYGLLGRKLGHSWSAPIHEAFGCKDYRLIELEPEQLGEFLKREDIGGLNVTIPYKRDVMPFCDVIDPAAEAIGSVNTLVRRDGKLYGYNTDIDGFLYMLKRANISLAGKKVLVLGSGGASLTAQAATRQEGAREVVVISRSGPDNYDNLVENHPDVEVVINTTPVGMWPRMEGANVDLRELPAVTDVVDVIYNPGRTNLLMQAKKFGLRRAGGLPMLVAQAKRAEELFFDREIPKQETEAIVAKLWREMTNIVLVGMPGCGKTTTGKAVAELSGRPFMDVDEEIVKAAGKPIPEIFAQEGEEAFRALEKRVLKEACAKSGQVIATGGGVVLDMENRKTMRRTGWVYLLRRDVEDLPTEGRPLSQKRNLKEMERTRGPLYQEAADVVIDKSVALEERAGLIWRRDFCERSGY